MKTIKRAHKIKLNSTPEQSNYFWRAAGTARFAYNWGLAEYNRILDHNSKAANRSDKIPVSGRRLKKEFNKIKPTWVSEVTTWAYQGAFDDLQTAFRNFFQKHKKGLLKPPKGWRPRKDNKPLGWPTFKSKYKSIPTFYQANQSLRFNDYQVKLPVIGWVNMTEPLRFDGKILGGRVSYKQGYWWLSVQVEFEADIPKSENGPVGVDLGIKYLAVTSDGKQYDNPKPFTRAQDKLRRFQRKLDRQRRANNLDNYNDNGTIKKGAKQWVTSNKMQQTELRISKLHARIANIRLNASHELTTEIAKEYSIVCLEDLNIKGMMQNGKLSKAIGDAALYEKRRQLEYKVADHSGDIVFVDQWFPSSKRCNNCGWIYAELSLSERS